MQLTLQNLSDQRQTSAAESGYCFRPPFHDHQDIPVETPEPLELTGYEQVGFAELIEELMEFRPTTNDIIRDIERKSKADLGPTRFAQVKELLLRVRQSDRMI